MKNLLFFSTFFFALFFRTVPVSAQVIVTAVGNGTAGFSGDGHPATDAEINGPYGLILDSSNNLYICDGVNRRIRKVSPGYGGVINTIVGVGIAGCSGDNGLGVEAEIDGAWAVAVDKKGNTYIADAGPECDAVRKITPADTITTIAGTGITGYNGDGIPATAAQLNIPEGVTVDDTGNIYITDFHNYRIRKIDTNGIIHTIAGTGVAGYSVDGSRADTARLSSPGLIMLDKKGNIFYTDSFFIRKIDLSGIITTVAGNGIYGYSGDSGLAVLAEISTRGIAVDTFGNVYIADGIGNRIRKVDTFGIIYSIAGSGLDGFYGDNGNPLLAKFSGVTGIAVGNNGDIYISDIGNNRIRLVTMYPEGVEEINYNMRFINILPNPINTGNDLAILTNEFCQLILYDLLGKPVYKGSFSKEIHIPCNLPAGIYSVEAIFEDGSRAYRKLVVR